MDDEQDGLKCDCGAIIGTLVRVGDRVWLHVENSDVRYLHGRCCACGKIVHFDSRDYQLRELIARVKRARMVSIE